MAITSSFIYNFAKQLMLGRSSIGTESVASLSLTTSMYAALILESHTPDACASTTGSYRSVLAARVNNLGEHAGWGSVTNDVALTTPKVSSSAAVNIVFFDADNCATPSVSTGQSVGGILIYKRVTSDADSLPVALIDIGSPVTTNGASININWDNGANRIFAIT